MKRSKFFWAPRLTSCGRCRQLFSYFAKSAFVNLREAGVCSVNRRLRAGVAAALLFATWYCPRARS